MAAGLTVVAAAFDYKYGGADWRLDPAESFQKSKEIRTKYTTADGQLIRTVETTKEYKSGLAQVSTNPIVGPPYLYGDGTFHADVSEPFQTTRVRTTTYEAFSETSYQVTIDDFDVLLNKHTISHAIVDGQIPLAPTKKSALTSLILRPIVGTLLYQCSWVPNTVPLNLHYAEDEDDIGKAARRQQQRDTAIVRTIDVPLNPRIREGQTGRLIDAVRSIDALHMIVGVKHTQSSETGKGVTHLEIEYWNRNP